MDASSYRVDLKTDCVYYDPLFLTADEADRAYAELWHHTPWQTTAKINRWVCLMEDHREPEETSEGRRVAPLSSSSSPYRYRDAPDRGGSSLPFTDLVRDLARRASTWYEQNHPETKHADNVPSRRPHFNVCLLNFYENGQQRIGWHCDREEIGRTTPIAAISLGATRSFHLRSQIDGYRDRTALYLTSGSLLVMENTCQTSYLHAVPREPHVTTGRINLTFRCKEDMMDRTAGEEIHARRDEWLQSLVAGVEPDDGVYRTTGPDDAARKDDDTNVVFGDTASTVMPTRHDDDAMAMIIPIIQFIITTNLGAESYCAAELMELLQNDCGDQSGTTARTMVVVALPLGLHGCVAVCGVTGGSHQQHDDEKESKQNIIATVQRALLQSRSAHHILRYHTHFSLNDLTDDNCYPLWKDVPAERLYAHVKAELEAQRLHIFPTVQAAADDDAATAAATSFRVSCERMGGPHAFASHQVEFEIGGAISEFYHPNYTPKMKYYDVNIFVHVVNDQVVVGTMVNVTELSRDRHALLFRNQVSIKANLAFAMVRCANVKKGDFVADPFCGGGTILFEAMAMFNRQLTCFGSDVSKRCVEGARANAASMAYPTGTCTFECCDARNIRRCLADDSVDAMVSNLPWGVVTGKRMDGTELQTMYEIFLRSVWYTLRDKARLVVLVLRGLQFTRILRKLGGRYRILSVNVVRTTNNLPSIIVAEKLAVDDLNASIKGQLASLGRFVNFSPEIYHAIHEERLD